MGLFDKKQSDPNRVALQNIVLGINEKKMEVSEDFLDEMSKIYVSKRMKLINESVESFSGVQDIRVLYSKYTYINALLDELEKIEPYYSYNDPVPSQYRQMLEESKPGYVNQIITRAWRVLGYNTSTPCSQGEVDHYFEVYRSLFEDLPEDSQRLIDELHRGVYGYGINEEPHSGDEENKDGDADAPEGAEDGSQSAAEAPDA